MSMLNRRKSHLTNAKKRFLIELHSEAYYRALKKIEEEKTYQQNNSKKAKVLTILKLLFVPRKLAEEFKRNGFADNFLGLLVAVIIGLIGAVLRISAIGLLLVAGINAYETIKADASVWMTILDFLKYVPFSLALASFGSLFVIAGQEISQMKDSDKLYAYTSSIMGVLALIVAIISLLNSCA